MDSLSAFAMGEVNRGARMRVFDWDEAAHRIVAANAREASAGLSNDWEWTGGEILANGFPVPSEDTYTYLSSTWAIPELNIDGGFGYGDACWRWEDEAPGWDESTYWPESALAILRDAMIEGEIVVRELEA